MESIDRDIRVSFRHRVRFTTGVFAPSNTLVRDLIREASGSRVADVVVVVDDGVANTHPTLAQLIEAYCQAHDTVMRLAAPIRIVPGGEQSKNEPRHLEALNRTIHDAGLCRHSYVIAVGGGALLDVAGYAAATAHRGIRLIRVPTTVLAQDDSAVGVKNSINAFGTKNYFGTFSPPFAVINDPAFLTTLSDRDWLSGTSEAVKAALIKDARFFDALERDAPKLVARDPVAMDALVRRSAALHVDHIAAGGDPFESGSSRPLDFGHWAAHKLEQLTDHRIRHGEAVAIGISLDSTYACLSGYLSERDWQRITDLILALHLPVYAPELGQHLDPHHPRSVLRGLEEFREHLGGELTVLLLRSIGQAFDVHEIRPEVMIRSIGVLAEIDAARTSGVATEHALNSALARSE